MSHYFGIEEIKGKLFTITALALSGEEYCKRYAMSSDKYHHTYSLEDYKKLTKYLISNTLIEVAVKTRSLVDALESQNILVLRDKCITSYNAGSRADGELKQKDFRYVCNKIIHAEDVSLDFIGKESWHSDMEWWSGELTVSGTYKKEKWEFFFSVLDWSDQIINFLKEREAEIDSIQKAFRDLQPHS